MLTESTLILFKPDCVTKGHCGEVLARFEAEGFKMRALRMIALSRELLAEHYAHVADRPFFPEIVAFMQSSPVIAMVLEGENAVSRVRELLGPTDSKAADPGTIRGDFGEDMMVNVCHASDSPEAALVEIQRFFSPQEVFPG
jgi:nucleoside-diphosphate kinase